MKKHFGVFVLAAMGMLASAPASAHELGVPAHKNTPVALPPQDVIPIDEVLQAIPSPLEVSVLLKETGNVYNRADLNDAASVSRYAETHRMALNLGIYGTDLGYANIYGKNQDAIKYLDSVKKLADNLGIGSFFDYQTIKKLAESSGKLNELIQQTTYNFEKINNHLRERQRENVSVLMLTGGWLEALYLTTVVNQRIKNPTIREKIGDQKVVLDQLLLVLDIYKGKPGFAEIIKDMSALQAIYDQIEVEVVYGEPKTKMVNGQLVVESGTRSTVKVTDADIQKITALVRNMRSKIIK